jgi:WD40 repeat protein
MKSGFDGLRRGGEHGDGDGRDEGPDEPVRVTVLTRGLHLGLMTTALIALLALGRWGEPWPGDRAAFATLTKEGGLISALALTRDGRSLAVATVGDRVSIWDVASHRRRRTFPTMSWDTGLAFSPDGRILAIADQGPTIGLWDVDTGASLGTLGYPGRRFLWLAYSPDGRTLAAASQDETVMLWDVPTGRVRDTHEGPCRVATALAFSPDGRILAFTGRGGSILAWDVERALVRAEFPAHTSTVQGHAEKGVSIAFAPGGKVLASQGAFDPLVKLWDVDVGRLLDTIEVEPSLGRVVAFSPDGGRLILAGRGALREWDLAERRSVVLVDGLSSIHSLFAVTPDDAGTLAIAEGPTLTLRRRASRSGPRGASGAFEAHVAAGEGEPGP